MNKPLEHEWKEYLPTETMDSFWEREKSLIYKELRETYQMAAPPDWYVRDYFEHKITAEWRRIFCLEYLYDKTGRPKSAKMDARTLLECCRVHVEAAYLSAGHTDELHGSVSIDIPSLVCLTCGNYTTGSESDLYCARCYRQLLNNWSW